MKITDWIALTCFLLAAASCSLLQAEPPPPLSPQVQAALKRAGANKNELLAALRKAPAEQREGMEFLVANMPQPDLIALKADFLLENSANAYAVMKEVPWGKDIPKAMFLNNVLPYASINERRDNWRKDFRTRFLPLVKDCKTAAQAGARLNGKVFPMLKVRYSTKRPKADQSPYESIEAGLASCTGLSVLLVDACRAVGVPARFAGTPLWTNRSGNHSWVEIWDGRWHYTGAAEPAGDKLDAAWFGNRAATAKRDHPLHAIYATSFKRTPLRFPLVWNRRVNYVSAVNVTDRYTARRKKPDPTKAELSIRVLTRKGGSRVPAAVTITDAATKKEVFKGTAKDERFDANDHLIAELPIKKKYKVRLQFLNVTSEKTVELSQKEQLLTVDLSKATAHLPPILTFTEDEQKFFLSAEGKKLAGRLKMFFDTKPAERGKLKFDAALDKHLLTNAATVRKMAWWAYRAGHESKELAKDAKARKVTYKNHVSPYVVRAVGSMPKNGWPLFIAMHGGGGAPKRVNDQQWGQMMRYYVDQRSVRGYLYLAPRAPNDAWNGFYSTYNLFLTDRLIRQMLLLANVDPNKVYIMGYSHGGYGAWFQGLRMADHFAAIHASASAINGYHDLGKNLRNTVFTFMIGEKDTRHGRRDRCKWFDDWIKKIRGDRKDIFPVRMEFIKGRGHGGLPDRNKIKDMYPAVRDPVPKHVLWRVDALHDFNWLHVTDRKAQTIEAVCEKNAIKVTTNRDVTLHLLLDERLIDYGKPVTVEANGKPVVKKKLAPSLRTLCETLAARGDPEYMFTTRVPLTIKIKKPKAAAAPKTEPAKK